MEILLYTTPSGLLLDIVGFLNVIAIGNSGTGKTHVALGLGLAACQRGLSVGFTTAASLVHELIEARDERRLLNLQKKLARRVQEATKELNSSLISLPVSGRNSPLPTVIPSA